MSSSPGLLLEFQSPIRGKFNTFSSYTNGVGEKGIILTLAYSCSFYSKLSLVSKLKSLKSVIFEKISLGILCLNGREKKKRQTHSKKSCKERSRAQAPWRTDAEESTRGHADKERTETSST